MPIVPYSAARRVFAPPPPPGSIQPIVIAPFPLFRLPSTKTRLWGGVYQITSTATGKVYVGKSGDIRKRLIGHRNQLQQKRHASSLFQREYDTYGPAVFMAEVLEVCDPLRASAGEARHMTRAYDRNPHSLLNDDITLARTLRRFQAEKGQGDIDGNKL